MRGSTPTRLAACGLLALLLATASPCRAAVERFAVIVGNNHGLPGEQPLRFARSDAKRVYDVLHELGGFSPVNMVLLEDASSEELRSTLIAVNDRVRSALSLPGREVVLFVFYSGHGDAESLHLGPTRLPTAELYQLVRGSAAQFRLLVLDACESGAVTRRKGGRVAEPFPIPDEELLPGEGLALLTASAAHEDSQESDDLEASFFTQAFVSGLLGAADADRDGAVVLEEAYRYAYEATLRATSRSALGLQHPTFSYDLRGKGQLVLTRPALRDEQRGLLELPVGATYLVMRDGAEGSVVAEVGEGDRVRTLSLAKGSYFLRGRADDHLLEGKIEVQPATTTHARPGELTKIAYARLVRKGGREATRAHAIEAGTRIRSRLDNAERACLGGYAGYRHELPNLTLAVRAGACTSSFANDRLSARVREYDVGLRVERVWDVARRTALSLGVGPSLQLFTQHFETRGHAPTRRTLAGAGELHGALAYELVGPLYAQLDAAVLLYIVRLSGGSEQELRALPALRGALGLGMRF